MSTNLPSWIAEKLQVFVDPQFRFESKPHLYYYGERELVSVTTWGKQYSEPFDRLGQAAISAYHAGCSVETILQQWDYSNVLGTGVHAFAEWYWKTPRALRPNQAEKHQTDDLLIQLRSHKLHKFFETRMQDFEPVGIELRMFLLELGLAGTLDALLWHVPTQKLWVFDWKTNSKITTNTTMSKIKYLSEPFSEYLDNHHNNYSLQISWYRRMLAHHGLQTEGGVLVHVPPGNDPAYMLKCRDYTELLADHFITIS